MRFSNVPLKNVTSCQILKTKLKPTPKSMAQNAVSRVQSAMIYLWILQAFSGTLSRRGAPLIFHERSIRPIKFSCLCIKLIHEIFLSSLRLNYNLFF